jgi:TolB-like protein
MCTALTLLLLFTAAGFADTYVVIDSLSGKANLQRAGRTDWMNARKGIKLFNNDMIRVNEKSIARLRWVNGSDVYVNENTQMRVNLRSDSTNNIVVKHATVFFGAAFFVIKKALPKALSMQHNTKIYTPTAVLSIRGTSFEVAVDKDNGETDVRVLNGTVLVGNILKRESFFLSAGSQTKVAMNEDPERPKALLDKSITTLKTWIPPEVIGFEIEKQLAQGKRDRKAIKGKLEQSVLVLPLINASQYKGAWDLSAAMSGYLADRIKSHDENLEVKIDSGSIEDLVATGKEHKVRFVIAGEITGFDIVQHAEISAKADSYREYSVARVRLHIQLVDVAQDKMVWGGNVTGDVSGKVGKKNSWQEIGKLPFDLTDRKFASTIVGQAVDQSLEESAATIMRYVAD